jgi:hypothetical protein
MAHKFNAILFSLWLLLPISCFAEQLKILDAMGLTRAVKKTEGPVAVLVRVRAGDSTAALALTNVDGILPDVSGSNDGKGTIRFAGVREGTWRITSAGKVEIAQVSIEK